MLHIIRNMLPDLEKVILLTLAGGKSLEDEDGGWSNVIDSIGKKIITSLSIASSMIC